MHGERENDWKEPTVLRKRPSKKLIQMIKDDDSE